MIPLLLLLACAGRTPPPATALPEPAARFVIYSLWLRGQGEEHRAELDLFGQCLLGGSNFADFWSGVVSLESAGSWVVEPPEGRLVAGEQTEDWLAPMLAEQSIPSPEPGVTPLYVVYGHASQMAMEVCGHCASIMVEGRQAALAVVRTGPPCWPGQGPVRSLTQFTQHEISCAVELSLGEDHCAADGQCQGRPQCPDICDSFTGLYCPGAPEQSYTGCDGNPVRGWVVQKLSHKGQGTDACPECADCDFTVEALP